MIFLCKDCQTEFEINDKECEGYYNWKCPKCRHIAVRKDMSTGFGIIWKCDTGTYKKKPKVDKNSDSPCQENKHDTCSCCPKAG